MSFFKRFRRDDRGSMLIETALVAPIFVLMCLAGVEVSNIVVRQHELQAVANHSLELFLASSPETAEEVQATVDAVTKFAADESGLTKVSAFDGPNQIRIYRMWRCGNTNTYQKNSGCEESKKANAFLFLEMRQSYTPIWTNYGIGDTMVFKVRRSLQIG